MEPNQIQDLALNIKQEFDDQVGTLGLNGRVYPIKLGPTKIGRDQKTCDIAIDLEILSQQHAVINAINKSKFTIMDFGSRNLTKVGNVTLKPYTVHPLRHGDLLYLGELCGLFRVRQSCEGRPRTPLGAREPDVEIDLVSDDEPDLDPQPDLDPPPADILTDSDEDEDELDDQDDLIVHPLLQAAIDRDNDMDNLVNYPQDRASPVQDWASPVKDPLDHVVLQHCTVSCSRVVERILAPARDRPEEPAPRRAYRKSKSLVPTRMSTRARRPIRRLMPDYVFRRL